ncbi:hypothetical protein FXF61_01820 [Pseudomonas sp. C27(2019)]|uniref:carbamoyltransferase C-terminal domain-containing protein n=1 Tax=Pseudomonas sp. C27(2019) TaxID=2604941 RepID=UPI00124679ED|nr:carbamoyltransferase C-terminal domain-containing protein [Pseudomonas sp. C27(2019)]QEY57994.1 hypothetical protein FXF61_01820 [Pseudomonas sp. C27(2019)]
MYILGLHTGHDASACVFKDNELVAFCKEERLNRIKNDGEFFDLQSIDEVLKIAGINRSDLNAIALTRLQLPVSVYKTSVLSINNIKRKALGQQIDLNLYKYLNNSKSIDFNKIIHVDKLRQLLKVSSDVDVFFSNHHRAHALSAFKYVDWEKDTLVVTCDGGGDGAQYSASFYDGTNLDVIVGGEETIVKEPQNTAASIGLAYAYATERCGFKRNRHEGKLTGLAAFGEPIVANKISEMFKVEENATIASDLKGYLELEEFLEKMFNGLSNQDIAASIQAATEAVVNKWVKKLLEITNAKYIAMSGGVFSNVKLNQNIAELDDVKEIFVFPAMGDEGLSVGVCVDYLVEKNGINSIERKRLSHVYLGWSYDADSIVNAAVKAGFSVNPTNPVETAAKLLADHKVGAIYTKAMEMGPRALGARTILANPAKRDINDSINKRLQRTEFMPFAPYVLDIDAEDVFEISDKVKYACNFMTVTTQVKSKWADKIAAVVHVDGTARPQIIERVVNPLYYAILEEFKKETDLPVLVNTSFNAHEEPIINTPEEALQALKDNRIDFIVCDKAIIT